MLIERYWPLLPPPRFTCATTAMPKTIRMNVPRNSASSARFKVGMGPDYLRIQQLVPPGGAFAGIEHAIVETVGPGAPELHPLRDEAVAAPVRRTRDGLRRVTGVDLVVGLLERLAALERLTLRGRPRADLTPAWTAGKIRIGLSGAGALDQAFNP